MLDKILKTINKYSSIRQLRNFCIVGFIAFFIDYGLLYLLTDCLHIEYLISAGTAFTISMIFNYLASMKYVYVGRGIDRRVEFIKFYSLALGGLVITEILMWLFTDVIGLHYMISKIFVAGVVMVYNFVTRKLFIEKKDKTVTEETE